ncbi:MAG: hypothetical protein A3H27_15495 [Acidobacteria bacterium RIFCSPLOWO2_02_FULL_59_13]|nr:MAG: hypothetical protein A3H27_15495 [Acidobacteria bacterium RIFCSPLOWO2_02_FULL_59_13]
MALPKFNDLSTPLQVGAILLVGALVFGASEYTLLSGPKQTRQERQTAATRLENENKPLREYVPKHRQLIAENQQLEMQLQNLQQIVPSEKGVDDFVRDVQAEASLEGVMVRSFTARAAITQEFYVELPFVVQLDGAYDDVLRFYERLPRLPRIINVSELNMGGIESGKGGGKKYNYSPSSTVVAVCTVTTFFSREVPPPEPTPAAAARPSRRARPAPAPRR